MAVVGNFTSTQDLSAFLDFGEKVKIIHGKKIEYGYYDDRHSSGLNLATLAAIHEYGWNNLPMRNFMTSTAILFQPELNRAIKRMFQDIIAGKGVDIALGKIAQEGVKKIEFVIDQGLFSNPTVSPAYNRWRQNVGSNNPGNSALFHYGDLKKGAKWKIA